MFKARRYVTISKCPPRITKEYWATLKEAQQALDMINRYGCGGQCRGEKHHRLVDREATSQ